MYTTLSNYNNNKELGNQKVSAPKNVKGEYIVPIYKPQTYAALTHNMKPNYVGYFDIEGAYGKNAEKPTTYYETRKCNSY